MEAHLQAQIAFHLTGSRADTPLGAIEEPRLAPALFAGYRDLATLRYDFPLVLVDGPGEAFATALSEVVDEVLARAAEGHDADRVRQHVLRLESALRALVAGGHRGRLSDLWDAAATPMADSDELVADSLARARLHLDVDGEVVDCDDRLPFGLVSHAWRTIQDRRGAAFNTTLAHLILKLSDILKADFQNSTEGRSAENLRSSFGTGPLDTFDFEAMSQILVSSTPASPLPASRRARIEDLLSVLQSQRFFATPTSREDAYSFSFEDCASAMAAYNERLPRAIDVARAIAIGQLEIRGEYDEAKHDALFASFGNAGLDEGDMGMFPDYLVRLDAGRLRADEQEQLFDLLSADLPFKVLVQTDDVLEESTVGGGHLAFAMHSRGLASTAIGLTGVFVLQSPSSSLPRLRLQMKRGLDYTGPALFSVFSGASPAESGSSCYLVSAAALESRVFPVFVYDPSAGSDWASRFSLTGNPQPDVDWPVHDFSYRDSQWQGLVDAVPFTLVDFVASDPRYCNHFARVPRGEWSDALVPVDAVVASPRTAMIELLPSLLMVDADDLLHKVIVDEKLIREARRCLSLWHSLQELGGIHNSHAERAVRLEESRWQERMQQLSAPTGLTPAAVVPSSTPPAEDAEAAVEAESERPPDEPYIETARCSTCNECTQINSKMFMYNENQQAYIADLGAGTYAQLVEAAESCQVSVIHPGKPRDPNEPGLEDLLKRAELFA